MQKASRERQMMIKANFSCFKKAKYGEKIVRETLKPNIMRVL
jgi:hypothetical protein